ncbi:FG-GAP repeat domain-containing protein [Nibricoccus sp. IMCC34717]|uniref:FG-GAP repeat domain-containing protein n=1 Tax=Nibricoccus sp. IMCC34717 TaxID=3034021 RepID=UPI00384EF4D8
MKSRLLASFVAAGLLPLAHGVEGPVPSRHLSLGGPLVVKLDWGTRALQSVDVDGDGLRDLVVVNGDKSAIDILYQNRGGAAPLNRILESNRWEPQVEDAPFRKASVTTNTTVYDLACGDLNGDGRPDLIYTGEPDALTVRYQKKDGSWTEQRIPDAPAPSQGVGSTRLADLDGDGKLDYVMLGQKELAVFRQQADGTLGVPERYALAEDGCYGLEIVDVDQDGRPDLLYLVNGSREPVRVRRQTASGKFGAELGYAIKPTRCTLQILPARPGTRGPTFAFAQDTTGHMEEFRLVETQEATVGSLSLRPRVYSPRPGAKSPSAYVVSDIDGDGLADVVATDPDGAQLYVYRRQKEGGFTTPESYPAMADVRSAAAIDWDGDGRTELFLASPKEQMVGVARWQSERLSYPQPFVSGGKPSAVAALSALAPDKGPVLAVAREEGGKRWVEVYQPGAEGPKSIAKVELTGMRADPRALRWVDANQDGRMDLAVLSPFDAMRLLVQQENQTFVDVSTNAGFRKGLVENLDASALTIADLAGDGKPELLVHGGAFARVLRLDAKGQLEVVDQMNARESGNEIAATLVLGREARPPVVFYEKKGEQFQVLQANGQGLYQVKQSLPAGKIDSVGAEVRYDKGVATEAFLFGRDRFWWLPFGQSDHEAQTVATHASDLPEISYSDVIQGDLNGDGVSELVCNDPNRNTLEILGREADGSWASLMHFKVFEVDPHFQGKKGGPFEPRETVLADVTGDGKTDLVLLVHDRILVYPQQ